MLQLTFEYEETLKNQVKLEASITITQYIYVWFSFNADSGSGDFKVEVTPFSQTDIEFKVLICSADEDDDDVPPLSNANKAVPSNIYVFYDVVDKEGNAHSMGSNEPLTKYEQYKRGTSGYETGIVLASYTGSKEEVTNELEKMRSSQGTFADFNDYFTYALRGKYYRGMLTVIFYDNFGNYSSENVMYEGTYSVPQYWITNMNNTQGKRFIGWDTNNDGNVDILPDQEFVVKNKMVLYPIMAGEAYTITITDLSGVTTSYMLNYGEKIPQSILDIINNEAAKLTAPNEDSYYTDSYWRICASDFVVGDDRTPYFKGTTSMYYGDVSVMPACDLVFQTVEPELYHYVSYVDETGGYFEIENEDGTISTSTMQNFV